MDNHFHLVVETPGANLVAGMKWFLGAYTARFNSPAQSLWAPVRRPLQVLSWWRRRDGLSQDGVRLRAFQSGAGQVAEAGGEALPLSLEQLSGVLDAGAPTARLAAGGSVAGGARPGRGHQGGAAEVCRADGGAPGGRRWTAEWKAVRRGWCLGGKEFRRELLKKMRGRTARHRGGEERAGNRGGLGGGTAGAGTQAAAVEGGGIGATAQRRRGESPDSAAAAPGNDDDGELDCQPSQDGRDCFPGKPAAA